MQDNPEIKAVEMTRRIRDAHRAELEGKTPEERIAFYRQRARLLHAELGLPEELANNLPSTSDYVRRGR